MSLLLFDFGSGEILLIILAVFLIFGPEKIPELARNLGKFVNDIKRASEDIKTEINREADRKEREKRLEEYKAKMSEDEAAGTSRDTDKEKNRDHGLEAYDNRYTV